MNIAIISRHIYSVLRIYLISLKIVKKKQPQKRFVNVTDQEFYEYIRNANISQTTQLTPDSIDLESTTPKIVYSYASLTRYKEYARPFQNTDTPNTPSHV